MRFGICTGPENAGIVARSGYDYIELGISGTLLPEKPESEVLPNILRALDQAGIQSEAANGLLPGDLKIVGPDEIVDLKRQFAFLDSAFKRAAKVGVQVAVFGSGAARRVPDGFPQSRAEDQIAQFLQRAGDAAGQNGILVVIEPLNAGECNILNSVAEGLAMVERVSHPNVQVLSDYYHVARDKQSFDETAQAGGRLRHVHVATAEGRMAPLAADEDEMRPYFAAVKRAGYDARVSIEGGWRDFAADAPVALATLREAWSSLPSLS
jgi:D-psicose/D-tagatose/L-ribulose 3-epimerase